MMQEGAGLLAQADLGHDGLLPRVRHHHRRQQVHLPVRQGEIENTRVELLDIKGSNSGDEDI